MYDVIIVGGGPGGMSALLWCQRLGLKSILLERKTNLGGQLFKINNPVIDYLGIPATNGRDLHQHFVKHLSAMNGQYACGVEVQDFFLMQRRLLTNKGEYRARSIILALGSQDRKLCVPGEAEMITREEVYSASRDKQLFRGEAVAVIGGGDRALEGALLLADHGANVTLIHHSEHFRARGEYLHPASKHPMIRILSNSVVKEIIGSDRVTGVLVETGRLKQTIPVKAVFVRIGIEPSSETLNGQVEMYEDGYVQTNWSGETSITNVFAVGDLCTRPLFSCIAYSAAQGMVAAKTISQRIGTAAKSMLNDDV